MCYPLYCCLDSIPTDLIILDGVDGQHDHTLNVCKSQGNSPGLSLGGSRLRIRRRRRHEGLQDAQMELGEEQGVVVQGEAFIEGPLYLGSVCIQDERGEDALPEQAWDGTGAGGVVGRRLVGGVDVEGWNAGWGLACEGVSETHGRVFNDPISDHIQLGRGDEFDWLGCT